MNFDARFIVNNIIDGQPIATYVATHNGLYFATVSYNYFTAICETVDIVDTDKIKSMFNITHIAEYDTLIIAMYDAVKESIRKKAV